MLIKSPVILAVAAAASTTSSATPIRIALPDYGPSYELRAAVELPVELCQANMIARGEGQRDFLQRVIRDSRLPANQARRLLEVCAVFDAGARTLVALTDARQRADAEDEAPQASVIPTT